MTTIRSTPRTRSRGPRQTPSHHFPRNTCCPSATSCRTSPRQHGRSLACVYSSEVGGGDAAETRWLGVAKGYLSSGVLLEDGQEARLGRHSPQEDLQVVARCADPR